MPKFFPYNQANQNASVGESRTQEDFLETWMDTLIRQALWPLRLQAPPSRPGRKEIKSLAASADPPRCRPY